MSIDMRLPGTPGAAAEARHALDDLAETVPLRRLRDLRLLVTELVTNSVRHAGMRTDELIHLTVSLGTTALRVEVRDPGPGFAPRAPAPDPTRASGWGLVLVDEVSDRWGVDASGPGTLIWFELDRERP